MQYVLQRILDRTDIVEGGVPPSRVVKVIDVVRDPSVGQFASEGGLPQIKIPRRLSNAPITGPNQIDCISLELRCKLPSLPLRHVRFQAHYRAK